jgi:hypothetical protein
MNDSTGMNGRYGVDGGPSWLSRVEIVSSMDARAAIAAGEHPLAQVLAAVAVLAPGQAHRLITPFVPAPLLDKVRAQGLAGVDRGDRAGRVPQRAGAHAGLSGRANVRNVIPVCPLRREAAKLVVRILEPGQESNDHVPQDRIQFGGSPAARARVRRLCDGAAAGGRRGRHGAFRRRAVDAARGAGLRRRPRRSPTRWIRTRCPGGSPA